MSVDIDGIIGFIRTRPDDLESILLRALQRYPNEAVEIAARAIDAFPGRTARIAAVAARTSPENDGTFVEFVIQARPDHAQVITDGALKENPNLVLNPDVSSSLSRPAPGQTAAEPPPSPRSTVVETPSGPGETYIEPPLEAKNPRATFVEQPIVNPAPRQSPPAAQPPARQAAQAPPAMRHVVRAAPPAPAQPPPAPPAQPPPAYYQSAPALPPESGRSPWTYVGIGALIVMALVCGVGLTLVAGYELGFINPLAATATENSLAPLDQTLTAISSEVTLTSPAFEPTQPASQEPGDGPTVEATLAASATEDLSVLFPTDTPEPTAVPATATPAVATFTLSQGAFCRAGPSGIYRDILAVDGGTVLPIKGKGISPVDNVSIWWQVEVGSTRCFISSVLGTTSGNLDSVPSVAAPPTPTPTVTPTATPTVTSTP